MQKMFNIYIKLVQNNYAGIYTSIYKYHSNKNIYKYMIQGSLSLDK